MIVDRVATRLLETLGNRLWGFRPRLMAELVRRHGGPGTLAWFVRTMPRYERTRAVFGPLRTHLLTTVISLSNGCAYCAFGHGHALELVHLRDTGRLFPMGVEEMLALRGQGPGTIRDRFAVALAEAGLPEETAWLDRLLVVMSGRSATGDGSGAGAAGTARIAHLVAMFRVLNDCGTACGVAPDEAHDPVNKDARLKAEHARLRARRHGTP